LDHLYERIKNARERAGMTVNDAASALGVTRTQVWRLEQKSETLSAERLFEIADLYGVDPRQLFQGKDAPPTSQDLYRRIGEVVAMVEEQVQQLDLRPPPTLVADAVIEILQQEANQPIDARSEPFDPSRYRGLVALLFKQAAKK
jgi:transcriptional regulator with XRE-family HTH domain